MATVWPIRLKRYLTVNTLLGIGLTSKSIMQNERILVVGCNGFIGSRLVVALSRSQLEWLRYEQDARDPSALESCITSNAITTVILLAGRVPLRRYGKAIFEECHEKENIEIAESM